MLSQAARSTAVGRLSSSAAALALRAPSLPGLQGPSKLSPPEPSALSCCSSSRPQTLGPSSSSLALGVPSSLGALGPRKSAPSAGSGPSAPSALSSLSPSRGWILGPLAALQMRSSFTTPSEKLTMHAAERVIDLAIAKARELKFKPICVVVVDAGGHVIAAKREDGASFMRYETAFAKAYGSLAVGVPMRQLRDAARNPEGPWGAWGPNFANSIVSISQGRALPVPGGVIIKNHEETEMIGAVGVSGDLSNNDEIAALAGTMVLGLPTDPSAPSKNSFDTP